MINAKINRYRMQYPKYCSNVIYLTKGEWYQDTELERDYDFIHLEELEKRTEFLLTELIAGTLVEKVKSLFVSLQVEEMKNENELKTLEKFKNLEFLQFYLNGTLSFEINFNLLENLTHLQFVFDISCTKILPEFLFKDLTKLKSLVLIKIDNLNSNHFEGLEHLQTLILNGHRNKKVVLNQCLDSMVNLKHLELERVVLNQFSLLPFDKVEKLKLNDYLIKLKGPYRVLNLSNNNDKRFFRNLKNLKYLELSHNCNKYIPYTIPSTVETFETSQNYFESMNLKRNGVPFIYDIKHLVIGESQNLEKFNLFREVCAEKFQNLESLHLRGESNITTTQLKSLKNLNSLTLDHVELKGIDMEFNYLTEASFTIKIPENIVNFYNLEKLCLEHIYPSIPVNETFLENLTSLEELKLKRAFDSIDEDVQYLFKSLTNLKKLTMTNNKIKTIKSSYFDYLINLEELDLSSNSDLKIIQVGSFKNLTKLKYLDLSWNRIKEIKKETFRFNSELQKVVLKNEL